MAEQLIRLFEDSKATGTCRGCSAPMEWYETVAGKRMPMNAGAVPRKSEKDTGGRVIAFFSSDDSHWSTCPVSKDFGSTPRNHKGMRGAFAAGRKNR